MNSTDDQRSLGRRPGDSTLPSDNLFNATRSAVEERASELALLRGRKAGDVTQDDRTDARRELQGETESVAGGDGEDMRETVSASRDPSDPVVSLGRVAPASMSAEDEQNRRTAEVGVDEAQHQLMLAARGKKAPPPARR